jgi:hypothetical protein
MLFFFPGQLALRLLPTKFHYSLLFPSHADLLLQRGRPRNRLLTKA